MLRISISRQWAKILLVLLALGLAASCEKCGQSGRPMLWKVDGKKSSYLFGTIHFPDERVLKLPESVRKALGATEQNVITVISKSVVFSVAVSILIALPAAYFMMQDWLSGFPYNVGFQPLLFLSAALLAIIIAMITVTVTSLKAARTNPAIALHYE